MREANPVPVSSEWPEYRACLADRTEIHPTDRWRTNGATLRCSGWPGDSDNELLAHGSTPRARARPVRRASAVRDSASGKRKADVQAALALDCATWVAITSISAGDRQS